MGRYIGTEQTIPKDKDYVMKFVKSKKPNEIHEEIFGREMHMKISTLLLKKDGNNFSIVPDILLYSTQIPIYSIEEKGGIDLYYHCFTEHRSIKLSNILEMIEAVYFLHNNNIVNRDIKPENFIVCGIGIDTATGKPYETIKIIGDRPFKVEKVSYSDETVWIDKNQTRGIKNIPETVWKFNIGGYQVCEKWLKDRGPKKGNSGLVLSDDDIKHYKKIIICIQETLCINIKIDKAIEAHGGWPDAFKD